MTPDEIIEALRPFLANRDQLTRAFLQHTRQLPDSTIADAANRLGLDALAETHYRRHLAQVPQDVAAAVGLASVLAKRGRRREATDLLDVVLQLAPTHAEAALARVQALVDEQRHLEAGRLAVRLLSKQPENWPLWRLAAHAFAAGEAHALSRDMWSRVVAAAPSDREAWRGLGNASYRLLQFPKAAACFANARKLGPPDASLSTAYAMSLLHMGAYPQAVVEFREALAIDPLWLYARMGLAIAYQNLGEWDQAVEVLEKLVADEPLVELQLRLGNAYIVGGRAESAKALYESILAREPGHRGARAGLGQVYERTHRYADAVKVLDSVVAEGEPNVDTLCAWARSSVKMGRAEGAVAPLLARGEGRLTPSEGQVLFHNLGTVYEALHDIPAAFGAHLKGNRFREHDDRMRERLRDFAHSARVLGKPARRDGSRGAGMVFVLGMPRSGTSLVEQILGCHSQVHAGGELPSLRNALQSTQRDGEGRLLWPQKVIDATDAQCADMGQAYLQDALRSTRIDASSLPPGHFLTDKQPGNFTMLGAIPYLLPGARVVHCRRAPLDTCLSCFLQNFGPGHVYSTELNWLAATYRAYRSLMAWWTEECGIEVISVDYEDLIADTEASVRRLLDALGLPFEPACLQFYRSKRDVRTASYAQVQQPIYTTSVGRAEAWLPFLQPLVDGLGDLSVIPSADSLDANLPPVWPGIS